MIILALLASLNLPPVGRGEEEKFVYQRQGRRDPFVPLVGSGGGGDRGDLFTIEDIKDVFLEGIIWDPQGESLAVINGEIVREGSQFQNIKVLKVEKERVTVLLNEKEYTVTISEEEGG